VDDLSGVRFIVDEMFGNVVRWLRILGFDTLDASSLRSGPGEDIDTKILLRALEEGRVLVTADVGLARRAEKLGVRVILFSRGENDVCWILRRVLREVGIESMDGLDMFSRCPLCNGVLRSVAKEEVKDRVPEGVFERVDEFWVCENCGKIYWVGSHFKNIRKTISCVFSGV